jgi:hypothetical protein
LQSQKLTDAEAAAAARIHPLRDMVCVKPLTYAHPLLAVPHIRLNRGLVVATGTGRRLRRMLRYASKPGALTGGFYLPDGPETGKVRPMRVSVGDVVEYSPNKHTLHFYIDGCEFVMLSEQSVYGKATGVGGILEQRSAGWARSGGKESFLAR